MSYEKYFWHVNDNNNLINTSIEKKIYDEENSKINFVIDSQNNLFVFICKPTVIERIR